MQLRDFVYLDSRACLELVTLLKRDWPDFMQVPGLRCRDSIVSADSADRRSLQWYCARSSSSTGPMSFAAVGLAVQSGVGAG